MDDLNEYMETVLLPDEQFDALFCLFRLSHSNAFAIYPCDGTVNKIYIRTFVGPKSRFFSGKWQRGNQDFCDAGENF